jgi:hydrogenase nickel incorporation protein HypB
MVDDKSLKIIELNEDLVQRNVSLANQNSIKFQENKIKTFDVVGAIGAGKTSILEYFVKTLPNKEKILVINGDVTTRVDADRIQTHGAKSIQINTGRECALNAYHISRILDHINLNQYQIVFIENVGNLICPSDFLLGAQKRIVVVSITEGPWVIRKHPLLFKSADVAVINKIDLNDVLKIDIEEMINDAKLINPNLDVFAVSAKTGYNMNNLVKNLF